MALMKYLIFSDLLRHVLFLTEENAPHGMTYTPEAFLSTMAQILIYSPEMTIGKNENEFMAFKDFVFKDLNTTPEQLLEKIYDDRAKNIEFGWDEDTNSYNGEMSERALDLALRYPYSIRRKNSRTDPIYKTDEVTLNEFTKGFLLNPTKHLLDIKAEFKDRRQKRECFDNNGETDVVDMPLPRKRFLDAAANGRKLHDDLSSVVLGQEKAIQVVSEGCFRADLDFIISDYTLHTGRINPVFVSDKKLVDPVLPHGPRNVFLFAGPPGVGKTFLAKQIGKLLKRPVRVFDMTRFNASQEGTSEFMGGPAMFMNAKEGDVTGYVSRNPNAVIVFDEIEKAHIAIKNLFLQILEGGSIIDNYTDQPVSFVKNIVIFTTNAGRSLYSDPDRDLSSLSRNVVLDALLKDKDPVTGQPLLPPEICSRLSDGGIVMFNHINAGALCGIAKAELETRAEEFANTMDISTEIENDVCSALLYSLGGRADARTVCGRAADFFSDNIYRLANTLSPVQIKSIRTLRFHAEIPDDDDVKSLFRSGEPIKAMILGSYKPAHDTDRCTFIRTDSEEDILDAVRNGNISYAVIDMNQGHKAIELIRRINTEYRGFPIWLIKRPVSPELEREMKTLTISGSVPDPELNESAGVFFNVVCDMIANDIHRDSVMNALARSNKELSYVCECTEKDGTVSVLLRGMRLITAVRAEDRKDLLDSAGIPDVSFDDVIGANDAKEELKLFANFLREPKKFAKAGLPMPKGVILYGPPGTGKTMLAKAMAAEAGVPFIPTEGNRFKKKYVGEGAELVHEVFAKARRYAPCVLFVDEVDSIAMDRSETEETNNHNRDVLNAFLTEMDGFRAVTEKPVFVLCATNSDAGRDSSILDRAFLRRFDNRIHVDLPDRDGRRSFMERRVRANSAFKVSSKQLDNLAERSIGMSLDNIDSVFDFALRSAVRFNKLNVTDDILDKAFEDFNYGSEKKTDKASLAQVACHEAGHAIVSRLLGNAPAYITIVSRGNFGGYMQRESDEKKSTYTEQELLDRICICLAGRAAEIVSYGKEAGINTGASSDIANATGIARSMVCNYGMDPEIGMAAITGRYSGELELSVNRAVNRILNEQLERAEKMLTVYKLSLDKVSAVLCKKNSLSGADFEKVFVKSCKH